MLDELQSLILFCQFSLSDKSFGQLKPSQNVVLPIKSLRTYRPSPCSSVSNSVVLPPSATSISNDVVCSEYDALIDDVEPVFDDDNEQSLIMPVTELQNLAESPIEEESAQNDNTSIDNNSLKLGMSLLTNTAFDLSQNIPLPSRVIGDIWHIMDRIKIPQNHGIAKKYAQALSQGIFIVDEADKAAVSKVLSENGSSWDKKLVSNPKWLWRRCKRYVPRPDILLPVVRDIFLTYGPILCSKSKKPLFNEEAWKKAKLILEDIYLGHVSDPVGYSLYYKDDLDGNKLPLYRCIRGTNGLEGGIHQKMIARFGPYNASVSFSVGLMSEYVLRHNLDVSCLDDGLNLDLFFKNNSLTNILF